MSKLSRFGVVALALSFMLAPVALRAQDSDAEVSWLMVVQGRVTAVEGNSMTLDVRPSAIVFSDRPERLVGMLDLASFTASAWGEGGSLTSDPPNASVINETTIAIAIIVVSDMAYAGGALTVTFEMLSGPVPATGDELGLTIDAFPTAVNSQITDSVTQTNVKVLGDAPAEAMGDVYEPV